MLSALVSGANSGFALRTRQSEVQIPPRNHQCTARLGAPYRAPSRAQDRRGRRAAGNSRWMISSTLRARERHSLVLGTFCQCRFLPPDCPAREVAGSIRSSTPRGRCRTVSFAAQGLPNEARAALGCAREHQRPRDFALTLFDVIGMDAEVRLRSVAGRKCRPQNGCLPRANPHLRHVATAYCRTQHESKLG